MQLKKQIHTHPIFNPLSQIHVMAHDSISFTAQIKICCCVVDPLERAQIPQCPLFQFETLRQTKPPKGPLNSSPPTTFPPNVFSYGYFHSREMTSGYRPHHFPPKGTSNTTPFFALLQQKLLKSAQNSIEAKEVGGLLCNQVIRELKPQRSC